MGAPAHLGRGRPFFANSLDAPSVDELVYLLRLIRDLRITFAAMNDFDAELMGEMVKLLCLGVVSNFFRVRAAEFLVC